MFTLLTEAGTVARTFNQTAFTLPVSCAIAGQSAAALYLRSNSKVACRIDAVSQCDLSLKSRSNIRVAIQAISTAELALRSNSRVTVTDIEAQSTASMNVRRKREFDLLHAKFVEPV